jgi:hypothetical protein
MVKLAGRARWLIVHSRAVELEGRLRSINGNRSWTKSNLGLEIILVSSIYVGVVLQVSSRVLGIVSASVILSLIRIRSFGIKSLVADDVVHGLSHETSVTTLISLRSGTIHQVLLRERNQFVGRKEVASFDGSSGRERPARTTLLLVLNGSYCSLGSPIKRSRQVESWSRVYSSGYLLGNSGSKVDAAKLLYTEVTKFVHGDSEGFVGLVVCLNEVQVRLEHSVSVEELIMVVALLVLLHPKGEGRLVLGFGKCESTCQE